MKIRFPSVTTQRDRRTRYGGKSSQNLFMIGSHGLVGLMVFYDTVIAKFLFLLMCLTLFSLGIIGGALVLPATDFASQRILLWISAAIVGVGLGALGLLVASALTLIFKRAIYALGRVAANDLLESRPP